MTLVTGASVTLVIGGIIYTSHKGASVTLVIRGISDTSHGGGGGRDQLHYS